MSDHTHLLKGIDLNARNRESNSAVDVKFGPIFSPNWFSKTGTTTELSVGRKVSIVRMSWDLK